MSKHSAHPFQMSHEASSILKLILSWRGSHHWVKLDRLGRKTRDGLNLVHELEEKGVSLRNAWACRRYRRADGPHEQPFLVIRLSQNSQAAVPASAPRSNKV